MGYDTNFTGRFTLNRALDDETYVYLKKFNKTRRMARKVKGHGVEGEFYVDGTYDRKDPDIIDYNRPPSTQPGLWCHWMPSDDRMGIEWDTGEKFYFYIKWIIYIIKNFLKPKGYVLNGDVAFSGTSPDDRGTIRIIDNIVFVVKKYEYSDDEEEEEEESE